MGVALLGGPPITAAGASRLSFYRASPHATPPLSPLSLFSPLPFFFNLPPFPFLLFSFLLFSSLLFSFLPSYLSLSFLNPSSSFPFLLLTLLFFLPLLTPPPSYITPFLPPFLLSSFLFLFSLIFISSSSFSSSSSLLLLPFSIPLSFPFLPSSLFFPFLL